jgi:transcriptional regulator with XRE-family HTH domain
MTEMSQTSLSTATDAEVLRHLGARLRALRERRQLSAVEAAKQSGLARRTLYRAEHGLNPTLETLVRLLRLYGELGALVRLLPEPEASPMAVLESARKARRG